MLAMSADPPPRVETGMALCRYTVQGENGTEIECPAPQSLLSAMQQDISSTALNTQACTAPRPARSSSKEHS